MIVSFSSSLIKFGSYDREAMIDSGLNLRTYRTVGTDTWAVKSTQMTMQDSRRMSAVYFNAEREILFEP